MYIYSLLSRAQAKFFALAACLAIATAAPADTVGLVTAGVPGGLLAPGAQWTTEDGAMIGAGPGHQLSYELGVGEGDARIAIELSLDTLDGTAASFVLDGSSHFGFDGLGGKLFVAGELLGGATRDIANASDYITAGQPFNFVVERKNNTLLFFINDQLVHEQEYRGNVLNTLALRPHRATMRVRDWQIEGGFTKEELAAKAAELPQHTDVFVRGESGYHSFRIPAVVTATNGDVLAFAEGRVNGLSDWGNIDLVMKRSTDGGATWSELQVIADNGDGCFGNPAPVVDRRNGHVLMLAVRQPAGVHEGMIRSGQAGYRDPYVLRSRDHGRTWSEPESLVATCDREEWRWYATGPCHGIQLQYGEHAGRLIIPANFSLHGGKGNERLGAHAIYSDDGGATWQIGAVDATHVGKTELNPNESTVVELADGRLMFNCRDQDGTSRATRAVTFSDDGGETFNSPYEPEERMVAPICQASLLGVDTEAGRVIIFSGPSQWSKREKLQLRYSTDAGQTWLDGPVLHAGSAAYSDVVEIKPGIIGCLYEADGYMRIRFARLPLTQVLADE